MNGYGKSGEHIIYLDKNNLYGKAMMLNLTVSDYKLDERELEGKNITDWILNYDFMKEQVVIL
jgi:hypothetical protein